MVNRILNIRNKTTSFPIKNIECEIDFECKINVEIKMKIVNVEGKYEINWSNPIGHYLNVNIFGLP